MDFDYTIIRSARRTLSIQIKPSCEVVVRAPRRVSDRYIREFVESKSAWVEKHLQQMKARSLATENEEHFLTQSQLQELYRQAREYIPQRVAYYAPIVGVDYGRITIKAQKTRWGSCSAKGNLNFNCLLMLTPPEVIDSVVVHELCHRKQMNHSPRFYAEVHRVFPHYDKWNRWLKKNGKVFIASLPR